jgi:hypothetical protein
MRRAGYHFEKEKGDELVFSRLLSTSRSSYPRFHIYVHPVKSSKAGAKQFNRVNVDHVAHETLISLHLDQKKPIYKGAPAHAAEYEGELVEKEAERIKNILGSPN